MCGLIAAFTEDTFPVSSADGALSRMERRGPDGEGRWLDNGVFLGHRRLAIVDLDPRATQPMHSGCGRYAIVFNGEIYNYRALRNDLLALGEQFHTTSDTEVILTLFAREGETMLTRLHGMFAFVIWDKVARKAFAARDPYGIKPLYIAKTSNGVIVASQVRAILATRLVDTAPDPVGQFGFWMLGSVPEPHTWFRDIQAVGAGHCLWIEDNRIVSQRCWHDIGSVWREAAKTGDPHPIQTRSGIQELVKASLTESVARHLVADVPVGVFLSGGIDSGALAGLMREGGATSLLGITIAYDEYAGYHWDEAPVAKQIAKHYSLRHQVRKVSRNEFMNDLPRIMGAMDQPSIDGINTWYASKAVAEQGLKVVVSGVGGDELFLGYDHFRQLPSIVAAWRNLSRVPGAMSIATLAASLKARLSGNDRWRHAPVWAQSIAGAWWLRRSIQSPEGALASMPNEASVALAGFAPESWIRSMSGLLASDFTLALAQIEATTYMRNQLLRDSDWASMDHSIELRTPLVDAHLLAQLQPCLSRLRDFPGKTLLAHAPTSPLPDAIIRRHKTGFFIPVNRWFTESNRESSTLQAMVEMEWTKSLK